MLGVKPMAITLAMATRSCGRKSCLYLRVSELSVGYRASCELIRRGDGGRIQRVYRKVEKIEHESEMVEMKDKKAASNWYSDCMKLSSKASLKVPTKTVLDAV